MKRAAIFACILLGIILISVASIIWSHRQLNKFWINVIGPKTPITKSIQIEFYKDGVNFIARRKSLPPPDPDDLCAYSKPILFPFGLWALSYSGKLKWIGYDDLRDLRKLK